MPLSWLRDNVLTAQRELAALAIHPDLDREFRWILLMFTSDACAASGAT
jgi:hypothetical protein